MYFKINIISKSAFLSLSHRFLLNSSKFSSYCPHFKFENENMTEVHKQKIKIVLYRPDLWQNPFPVVLPP